MNRIPLVLLLVLGAPQGRGQDMPLQRAQDHLAAAAAAEQRSDFAAARGAYRAAVEAAPDHADVLTYAAYGLAIATSVEEAGEEAWQEVLGLGRRASDLQFREVMRVLNAGQRPDGMRDRLVGVSCFTRAFAALELGRIDEARTYVGHAATYLPSDLQPLAQQLEARLPKDASTCGALVEMIRWQIGDLVLETSDPQRLASAYLEAGESLRQCGSFDQAVDYYERALKKQPGLGAASDGLRRAQNGDQH